MNTKKIIYSILKEIKNGNDSIKSTDYGISKDELGDIVEMMLNEDLIRNANVIRGGIGSHVHAVFFVHCKITLKGIDYLEENSVLSKTYKGLKEVREWLPL